MPLFTGDSSLGNDSKHRAWIVVTSLQMPLSYATTDARLDLISLLVT